MRMIYVVLIKNGLMKMYDIFLYETVYHIILMLPMKKRRLN